jgi:cation-transporting ATPase F
MTAAAALEAVGGDATHGLRAAEAAARLGRDGPNRMTARRGKSALRRFLDQLVQPLIVVLIAAAVVSTLLGDHVDALVIGAVVLVNAVIGFLQEHRAEQAIAALDAMVVTEADVLRDGRRGRIRSEALVVGDLVHLQPGDAVPADLRLIKVRDLQVDEAALTGESVPAVKGTVPVDPAAGVGDRLGMAFAGTHVTFGTAMGVVVATGDRTETGRIARMIASATEIATPLTRKIAGLSKLLIWIILGLAAALFAFEAAQGADLVHTFNAAVAISVGAIPEGLPAAVTVLLAVGVSTMARRGALIRRLPAVETLGSTTVICSDKTGTLTENQMTVTRLWTLDGAFAFSGVGYDPAGAITRALEGTHAAVDAEPALALALRCGALCNDTRILRGDEVKVEGDPTEAALLVAADKAPGLGLDWPRLDAIPFASEHMYMVTLHDRPGAPPILLVKGSSEALLPRCVDGLRAGERAPIDRAAVSAEVDRLGADGLRVLLLASRELPAGQAAVERHDVQGLTLLGLVGMIDPPRPAAAGAVRACQGAGIQVKMITGDHAVTAAAIAAQIGLEGARVGGALRAVTGAELAELVGAPTNGAPNGAIDPAALDRVAELADAVAVFARVAPEQKLLLVRALQRRGHVVAMTGDGVNDAPALEQADIGVAMGKGGTDVARGAAAMILTDDDFATIAAAVEEGRGVYDNLVKFITWTLPTNGGEGLVLLVAIAVGADLPILPVQILWVNMATAVLLGISLVFEPKEPGLMDRPPRSVKEPILNRALGVRTLLVSTLMAAAAFGLFEWMELRQPGHLAEARTIAVNTIVVIEVAYLFACRSLRLPIWRLGLFTNPWVWVGAVVMLLAQLLLTYAPFMNRLFHTAPIEWIWWVYFSIAGAVVFIVVEMKKLVGRRAARAA